MNAEKFKAWTPLLIFLLLALAIAGLGYFVYQQQVRHLKESAQKELATIAALKAEQITRWRSERKGDALAASRAYFFESAVAQWFQEGSPPDERRQHILDRLTLLQKAYDYRDVELLDGQGALRLSTASTLPTPSASTRGLAAEAMRTGTILFSDLHREEGEPGQPILLDLFAPLFDESERVVGVMMFRIAPDRFLFPLIQSWPTPSTSAETMLVERSGNDVLYLNEPRHQKHIALALRLPITEEHLVSAIAVRGQEEVFEGVDYRNVPVLAATRKISDSPWYMVAKVDQEEVYAPIHERTLLTAELIVVLVALAGVLTALWWRQKSSSMLAREYQNRLERQALIQHFDYLAKYANDIILLFDSEFRIVEMNDRALEAYGYTREELLGRHIDELRTPAAAAEFDQHRMQLEERKALVYETQDLRKDKTVIPVEVSSRVIEIEGRTFYQSIIRDITERKRAEAAVLAERQRFNDVLNTLPVYLILLSPDYHVPFANRYFEEHFGKSHGQRCHEYLFGRTEPCEICETFKVLKTMQPLEWEWRGPDGRDYFVYDFPFTDTDGATLILEIGLDITERKLAEAEIKRLNADLEKTVEVRTAELRAANTELDSFAYAVSHDLRAPLRAMSGFSQALTEDYGEHLDGDARVYLDQISLASRHMSDLIDGLLVLSRSTRGELKQEALDISTMSERLLAELTAAEPARPVAWTVEPGMQAQGDATMIEVVMRNLIDNAWKYTGKTPDATIRVYTGDSEGQRCFCVSDNGAGFDRAHAGKLFQPFQRLHRQEEFPGIGIGLATVQRIVHRHGGAIWAEGAPDQGATFCFTLHNPRPLERETL